MSKTTPARNKAIGAIGPGAVKRLEAAGVSFVDDEEVKRLKQRCDELEQEVKRLKRGEAGE